ncbi:CsbD family protein [Synechococcus sp. CS-1330]|nr:CsbD family protein [Synechococcus sp. CS-1330]
MYLQIRILRELVATCVCAVFSLLIVFGLPIFSSPAQASNCFFFSTFPEPLAVTSGRVKADAKEFEGKTQESIGNVTGNRGDLIAGKAKQAEAKVRNTVEDVKDMAGLR